MPQRLSPLDASFLFIENPRVHMHVAGLSILDPSTRPGKPLTHEHLRRHVAARLHLVPRFRQRVMEVPFNLGRAVWVDDSGFDLDFHLRRAALPQPGGRRELHEFVQRVHSRPLDRTKPLWEIYLVEGLADGLVAILTKTHHAMVDGISAMDLGTVLFDFSADVPTGEAEPWTPAPEPGAAELAQSALAEQLGNPVRAAAAAVRSALDAPRQAAEAAAVNLSGIGGMLARWRAPDSAFSAPVGANRRFTTRDLTLAQVRQIRAANDCTVNDVVLAVVAGALSRYLVARQERTQGRTLRAMVPVSTRDEGGLMQFGNRVSAFFIDLPVAVLDEPVRLRRIAAQTRDLKESLQAVGASALVNLGTWAPPTIHTLAARMMAGQRFANLIVSNVPGPQQPLYLAGARQLVTYPVMPLAPSISLSVAVTSLDGVMGFGFTGDWDALPDLEVLADGLTETHDLLLAGSDRGGPVRRRRRTRVQQSV